MFKFIPSAFMCIVGVLFLILGQMVIPFISFVIAAGLFILAGFEMKDKKTQEFNKKFIALEKRLIAAEDQRVDKAALHNDNLTIHKMLTNLDHRITELDSRVSKNDPFGG